MRSAGPGLSGPPSGSRPGQTGQLVVFVLDGWREFTCVSRARSSAGAVEAGITWSNPRLVRY